MTISLMYAAGCQYWEWQIRPVDDTGTAIDPHTLAVEFAAVPAGILPSDEWSEITAQAAGHAAGSWQGPDSSGRWTARVLVSGPGGGGDIVLPTGTYRIMGQITSIPERPVVDTGTIILQ